MKKLSTETLKKKLMITRKDINDKKIYEKMQKKNKNAESSLETEKKT